MLLEYVHAAMSQAKYKILEDGTFYGEIPGFQGLWANEHNLETCREELQSALQDWLVISLRQNQPIPVLSGTAKRTCRHTRHGRLIRDEHEMAKRKCPYPHDPDL